MTAAARSLQDRQNNQRPPKPARRVEPCAARSRIDLARQIDRNFHGAGYVGGGTPVHAGYTGEDGDARDRSHDSAPLSGGLVRDGATDTPGHAHAHELQLSADELSMLRCLNSIVPVPALKIGVVRPVCRNSDDGGSDYDSGIGCSNAGNVRSGSAGADVGMAAAEEKKSTVEA